MNEQPREALSHCDRAIVKLQGRVAEAERQLAAAQAAGVLFFVVLMISSTMYSTCGWRWRRPRVRLVLAFPCHVLASCLTCLARTGVVQSLTLDCCTSNAPVVAARCK